MISNQSTRNERFNGVDGLVYYVLGGGEIGTTVAKRLHADDHIVCLVDESYDSSEFAGLQADTADIQTLKQSGVAAASTVIIATAFDRQNLLIVQLVSSLYDVSTIRMLVNISCQLDAFEAAGHDPVCATTALSDALVNSI